MSARHRVCVGCVRVDVCVWTSACVGVRADVASRYLCGRGFCRALVALQLLGRSYGAVQVSATRFFIQMVIGGTIMAKNRDPLFGNNSGNYFIHVRRCMSVYQGAVQRGGVTHDVASQVRWLLLIRGFFGTIGSLCFVYALATMRLSDASALYFTNPIVTALLARVVRHVHCAALWRCLARQTCASPPSSAPC